MYVGQKGNGIDEVCNGEMNEAKLKRLQCILSVGAVAVALALALAL